MTEQMIDHTKLKLSYVIQAIANCAGQEIPYPIARAMDELSKAIQEFIEPNMDTL